MNAPIPITVAYGDGPGPEIMEALLRVMREAGAQITVETIEVGQRLYSLDVTSGLWPDAWDSLRRTHVLLKAPTTTPEGCTNVRESVLATMLKPESMVYRYHYAIIQTKSPYELTVTDTLPDNEDSTVIASAESYSDESFALFEPYEDSRNVSGMLLAAYMLLTHIGQAETADRIKNGWQQALNEGFCPPEMHNHAGCRKQTNIQEFSEEIIARLWGKAALSRTGTA